MAARNNRFRLFARCLLVAELGMSALFVLSSSQSRAQSPPPDQVPPAPAQPGAQDANSAPVPPASVAPASPAPAQQDANSVNPQPASPPAAAVPRPPYPGMTPEDRRKQEVAQECADLLKLATDLKAQVDKTRKDELSVSVVRKATEIEQMAHKVKNGTVVASTKE